ncbi:Transcription repressor (Ovate family protein) [Psidium guajava]|nr:Transcription repressor (Ovate family protein) [Psidium guajava]
MISPWGLVQQPTATTFHLNHRCPTWDLNPRPSARERTVSSPPTN